MEESVKLSIADATKEVLSNFPYMEEFLESGCVNFSALAENITPKIKQLLKREKINKEAVIMSIIRYAKSIKTLKIAKIILKSLAESNITLKTDIIYANIPKTIQNLKILELFYSKIRWDKGEVFFIVQGVGEISVVMDKHHFVELKNKLKNQKIELQFPTTAIVIVHSPPEAASPGFIHFITKPIARAGISVEMLTMTRDTIFLVDERNSSRLFEILKRLIDDCRKLI